MISNIGVRNKKALIDLGIGVFGIFCTLLVVVWLNQQILMQLTLGWRMVLLITSQWLFMIVPLLLMRINHERIRFLMKSEVRLSNQILTGIILAFLMSFLFTVVPILLGFKEMVGSTSYTKVWQFAFDLLYSLFAVALAEEFVFRGYLFHKLLEVNQSKWFAILISSLLFGLFHSFQGDVLQVIVTTFLGILFCLLREKIKSVSLLSLVIIHGLYDALITLWVTIL
ncbi:CPBP family intramembrane glutamic endopeptidase [Sphaerochaeta sp. S2]|uniref:CPBP family intramembrane glutamic endopeptidase n=1 Tax=Sphaerochaeta sp. S2 TaxID=2798868 RepID=UPI0018E95BCA|nr:type II CAAX endopeptidase family protein [Sphaerochaeta sp. S2]MBJ2355824.1 CPBP family intramembrane metalloprotease [Sphaerochaeta sp. S2]